MSTDQAYLAFVLEQLDHLDEISHRAMMGEYVVYYKGKVIGGVYDNRFLIKATESVRNLLPEGPFEIPYEGAKEMLSADIEDRELMKKLLEAVYEDLPMPEPRKKKKG